MNWNDFRFVLALRRAGSLARAAASLEVDKATASRRLSALEEALGARLVERTRQGWTLSAAGERVADAAEAMEAAAADAAAEVSGLDTGLRGVVHVTAPVWFSRQLIIPALSQFRGIHPAVDIRLIATNITLNLEQRQADVAIRNARPTQQSMIAKRIGRLGSAIYAAPGYLKARGTPESRDDLKDHALVAYNDTVTYAQDLAWIAEACPNVVFRVSDTVVLCEAVRSGIGLGVLPCYIADSDPELVRVELTEPGEEDIFICAPGELARLPRVRAVMDWLCELFASHQDRLLGKEPART